LASCSPFTHANSLKSTNCLRPPLGNPEHDRITGIRITGGTLRKYCSYLTENTLRFEIRFLTAVLMKIQVPWVMTPCTLTDYPKDAREQVSLSRRYYLPIHTASYPTPSSVQRPTSHGRCLLYYRQPINTANGKMAIMRNTE